MSRSIHHEEHNAESVDNRLRDHSSLANHERLKRVNEVLSGYYFNFKTFGSWQFIGYFE